MFQLLTGLVSQTKVHGHYAGLSGKGCAFIEHIDIN
jgi:hypothetical protein